LSFLLHGPGIRPRGKTWGSHADPHDGETNVLGQEAGGARTDDCGGENEAVPAAPDTADGKLPAEAGLMSTSVGSGRSVG
jgi:hypothetical protein